MQPVTEPVASFIAGFVVAEGSFSETSNGRGFRFAVGLGATDAATCEMLHEFFEVGSITRSRRRKPHYDDEVTFTVHSLPALLRVVVPFMDEHLPPSYKRTQYDAWRSRLFDYWEHRAKRVRPCTVDGCAAPRRAHGLCRHHLFEQRGQ